MIFREIVKTPSLALPWRYFNAVSIRCATSLEDCGFCLLMSLPVESCSPELFFIVRIYPQGGDDSHKAAIYFLNRRFANKLEQCDG